MRQSFDKRSFLAWSWEFPRQPKITKIWFWHFWGVEIFPMDLAFCNFEKSKTSKSSETSRSLRSVRTLFLWFLAVAETLSSTLKKTACQKIVSSLRFSRHNFTCKSLSWILVLVDTNSVYTPNYITSAKYRDTEVHFYLFGTTPTLGGLFDGARMKQGWNIHLYLLKTRYRDFPDFAYFRYRIYWDFKGFTVYLSRISGYTILFILRLY